MNAQKANNTIGKVRQLQRKLYQSAKLNSKRKFHALYDKVYRRDILEESWKRVRASGGRGGLDGKSISDIEAYGVGKLLAEIETELKNGKYRPQPVRRAYISKGNGKMRLLGIPVIKDRIVQMAAKLVLEPVYEADFKDVSYGFCPKRSARQALEAVRKACNGRNWWVVDVDIQSYFDTINHDKLMLLVGMRISDRRMLKLIRQWLKAGVMTETGYTGTDIGSPQGGVISPLLSNIYLNYLDTRWAREGSHLGTLVRYADDIVVICRTKKEANHTINFIKAVMKRLELKLNPEKTKLVSMWDGKEGFDFLGMHHRRISGFTREGIRYYTTYQFPSNKAMKKMRLRVKEAIGKRSALKRSLPELVKELNPILRGWRNYYGLKTAWGWLAKVDWYIHKRFTIWYNKKRKNRRHLAEITKVRGFLMAEGLLRLAG
ncbi:MAG: group II intron reverse transcriptase/maturase [Bacteroidales bacterium]